MAWRFFFSVVRHLLFYRTNRTWLLCLFAVIETWMTPFQPENMISLQECYWVILGNSCLILWLKNRTSKQHRSVVGETTLSWGRNDLGAKQLDTECNLILEVSSRLSDGILCESNWYRTRFWFVCISVRNSRKLVETWINLACDAARIFPGKFGLRRRLE